jgi:metal-responsive CopG/Arc/MetJ family transcriptional regulator
VKTAISIPDETFERAERRARELGVSRSQLYSTAVEKWLDSHDTKHLTEQIDQVLGSVPVDEDRGFLSRASAKLAAHSQTA